MLTIEAPYYFIKGNTVFRDHQDPDQFYFLPGNPKLAAWTSLCQLLFETGEFRYRY